MVVALYGEWGSGKTSTLNLCLKALRNLHSAEALLTIHFNPWWYSSTGELLSRFFDVLSNKLECEESLQGIKEDLLSYRDYIVPVAAVTDLVVTGGYLTAGAEVLRLAADRVAQKAPKVENVDSVKARIGQRINESGRRIVVVIDDIDRLSAVEIRDIFKLVKALADFPNTHYLLAFDYETTTTALSKIQGTNGARYLEKIVQTLFRLPDPAPGLLMDFVLRDVEELVSQEHRVTVEQWAEAKETLQYLAGYGFSDLWISMRRVNRFIDTFRLTFPAVVGEVRVSDFFVLEALRVCESAVYERLVDVQGLLLGGTPGVSSLIVTGGPQSRNAQEEAEEATNTAAEYVCAASRIEARPVVMKLLKHLFPRVRSAVGEAPAYGSNFLDEWTSEKRVCVPEVFRVATTWGLPSGMVSALEVEELLQISDPDLLKERLLAYESDTRPGVDARSALEKISAFYMTKGDASAMDVLLRVVFSMGRVAPFYTSRFQLGIDGLRKLKDLDTPDAPKRVILECIRTYRVTPLMAEVMRTLGEEHGWREHSPLPEEYRILGSEDFEEVKEAVAEDIERQAQGHELLNRDLFDHYLYLWEEISGNEAPRRYLEKLIRCDDELVALLHAYAERSDPAFFYGEGWWQSYEAKGRGMKVRLLESFDLAGIAKERSASLLDNPPEWLSESDRELLEAFRQSIPA